MVNLNNKKGVIFSDIDGTLVFHKELHGIKKTGELENGQVKVLDSRTGKFYSAYDMSTELYNVYLETNTAELGRKLQKEYDFVFVSGARKSSMDPRRHQLNFFDGIILENGGMILNKDYTPDLEWTAKLEPEKKYLAEVKDNISSMGWVMDNKGRTTMLRVRKKDNPNRSDNEFKALARKLELSEGLKKTSNLGCLDVILASAGKGNAVRYMMDKRGYTQPESIGIGDDINDLEMLVETNRKYILGSSFPEAIETAKKQGWYISQGLHFDGINEIFGHILEDLKNLKN